MVTVNTKQILLFIYGVAFACCVIAAVTDGGLMHSDSTSRAYAAFLIIGCIAIGIVLLIELLTNFVESFRTNGTFGILAMVFMFVGGISLIIACAINTRGHMPFGWTIAACTLIMEAILMFLMAHFCT